MINIRKFADKNDRNPNCERRTLRATAVALGFAGCAVAHIASASEPAAGPPAIQSVPMMQMLTFLFLMLGPFKIIGPFMKITAGADVAMTRQVALRATFFASLGLLIAALFGESALRSYGIPLPVLALAAGIILFLVALQDTLRQFALPASGSKEAAGPPGTPAPNVALTPLAFPTIVTPYGIAAIVVFLALVPDLQSRLVIGAFVLVIMLLNLIVMLLVRHIGPALGIFLAILGAVLAIIQVTLGLQIIQNSLKAMGLL